MKKQEFLEELKRYLYVLEDEEQEDILQEYEQHIEMKINKGLNEEEAIQDFGSVRELAGEILEAYHVKLDSRENMEENVKKKVLQKPLSTYVSLTAHSTKLWVKSARESLLKGMKRLGFLIKMPFGWMGNALCSWNQKVKNCKGNNSYSGRAYDKNKENSEDSLGLIDGNKNVRTGKISRKRMKKRMVLRMFVKGIRNIYFGILSAVFWAGRLIWNCGVVCAAAFFAFIGLVFLYLVGMLLILWKQGYPLGGVMLGCMGAMLCFLSMAVFGCTFYRNKKQSLALEKESAAEEEKMDMVSEL